MNNMADVVVLLKEQLGVGSLELEMNRIPDCLFVAPPKSWDAHPTDKTCPHVEIVRYTGKPPKYWDKNGAPPKFGLFSSYLDTHSSELIADFQEVYAIAEAWKNIKMTPVNSHLYMEIMSTEEDLAENLLILFRLMKAFRIIDALLVEQAALSV